jgi:four helix bundle protein
VSVKQFEDIIAWQEARRLCKAIHEVCATHPIRNDFGMVDQLRRASVSIMANIAEGFGCASMAEFSRFLVIARRSALEVQSLLYCCLDAGYISPSAFELHRRHAFRVNYLINRFRDSLPTSK